MKQKRNHKHLHKSSIVALILAITMCVGMFGSTVFAASEFSDATHTTVNETSYNAIYWAVDNGIVKGYSDGSFQPKTICAREQFSIMLWRFAGEPNANAEAVSKFTDVSSFSNGAKKAVAWAVEQGIVTGFSDESFQPKADITRAQVAVMLWRYAGKPNSNGHSKFSDIGGYSANVQEAISWLESVKVASGYGDGTFRPNDGCQRQHMAIFLYRYAGKVLNENTNAPAVEPNSDSISGSNSGQITVAKKVVADKNGVKITVTGFNEKGSDGPELNILIENNTETKLRFMSIDESINGYMVKGLMNAVIEPGKLLNKSIAFFDEDLKEIGIDTVTEIGFTVIVYDEKTMKDFRLDRITVKTSAYGKHTQKYDASGKEIYNKDGIRIVAKQIDYEGVVGPELALYVENNTDKDITVQTRDEAVNGYSVDGVMSETITSGNKSLTQMTILKSSLTKNNISKIEKLEMSFHIYDTNTFKTIVDTETITLNL